MIIYLKNTASGLMPCYDTDYENKKKLKIGQIYKAEIKQARNYELHKKYFALINCAWEYLNERTQEHFGGVNHFRETVQIAAGHCEKYYSLERKEWIEQTKSISFAKMGEFEFRELYQNVRHVLFSVFLKHVTEDEFNEALINF